MTYATTITEIDLQTDDGIMNCHVITPDRPGPQRAVIVYMPASGIRAELVSIAARIASSGYVAVLPNSFYRLARHVDINANRLGDDDYLPVRQFMMELADNITNARIIHDTGVILDWLDTQESIDSSIVGGVGYCMGGRLVMAAAGAYPDRMIATASLYGSGIVTDESDSPHLKLQGHRRAVFRTRERRHLCERCGDGRAEGPHGDPRRRPYDRAVSKHRARLRLSRAVLLLARGQ